jgi:ABC-type branched-subunit amino acid transport system ATPase component/ABC-type branched-subunit amino acid transport system permease subunit
VPAVAVVVLQLVLFPMSAGTWLQGVVLGLLNAMVALGLSLVWRANRVLNFAQADMGTLPAALGVAFCIFWGWSWFAGLLIGLVAALVVGVATELIVIRRFRDAPRLTLTVATIGISQFLILAALLVPRLWGEQVITSPDRSGYGFPWHFSLTVGQQVFHSDDLIAAVVAIACLAGVAWFLRRSDTGIAVRAAAERSERAALLGIPVLRMELVTWVVASELSFLGVFLQGAILGFPLNASVGIVTLVTALAALALGGFDDVGPILAAAVGLGVLLQGVRWHNTVHPTFVYAVLGAVILVTMVVRRGGNRRSDRSTTSSWIASLEPRPLPDRLRLRPLAAGAAVVLLVVAALVPVHLSIARQYDLATLMAFGVIALSIAVLTGWAGQITLGQMGFAALGASLGAVATVTWRLDVSLGLVIVLAAGAIAGTIVGLPSLRFSGLLPAAATLAFALAASGYLFDPNQFSWIPVGDVVPQRALGLWNVSTPLGAYELSLVVGVLCLIGLVGVRASALGRSIRAVRDNELPAQGYAISAGRAKLTAYAISGALAAVGGFLLVHIAQHFDAATFAPEESLTIFTASVVGGVGSLLGVLLGAFYLNGSRWLLSGYWQLLPTAVGVLVVLWLFPGGFASVLYGWRDRLARRRAEASGEPLLGPATDAPADTSTVSRPPDPDALLEVRDLRVAYSGVDILFGVDLTVRRGEILALLGTNGAGKSTLLRAMCGTAPMTTGSVRFGDQQLEGRDAPEIARQGISQMPGGQSVFESLTVAENLRIAGWMIRRDPDELHRRIDEQYRRFDVLAQRRDESAANLSGGQQQMLGLAMALLSKPSLLLIDELSLGLAPIAVEGMVDHVLALRDAGTTVVVVEQSVDTALRLADRAYFLERGTVRFEGPTAELAARDDLLRSVYLSDAAAARPTSTPTAPSTRERAADADAAPVVALADVVVAFDGPRILDEVSLAIAPDEIVAVIGPNGAGKSTLFDVISGFTPIRSGHLELFGRPATDRPAARRSGDGLGRSFQDSRLFPSLSVTEVLSVACTRWTTLPDPLSAALRLPVRQLGERSTTLRVEDLVELMGLGNLRNQRIGELSTGQRRLVDIGCVLAHAPRLILLDEPSSGVAQREAEALVPVVRNLRDELSAALVVVEHDMAIAAALADRMVALDLGRVVTSGTTGEVLNHPSVLASYLGRQADNTNSNDTQGATTP